MNEPVDSAPVVDSVTWSLAMSIGNRPWDEMWSLVHHNLERIEATYKNGRMSSSMDLKCDILNFCVSSYHLREHIKFDPALPSRTGKRVSGKARVDPLIAAAGDFANTAKHYKRKIGPTSQISELTSTPTAKISWVDPNGDRVVERDALTFARDVDLAWRRLLRQESLIP
jgi:hypothetical protein